MACCAFAIFLLGQLLGLGALLRRQLGFREAVADGANPAVEWRAGVATSSVGKSPVPAKLTASVLAMTIVLGATVWTAQALGHRHQAGMEHPHGAPWMFAASGPICSGGQQGMVP